MGLRPTAVGVSTMVRVLSRLLSDVAYGSSLLDELSRMVTETARTGEASAEG